MTHPEYKNALVLYVNERNTPMKSLVAPFLLAVLAAIQLFPLHRESKAIESTELQVIESLEPDYFPAPIQTHEDSVRFMLNSER